METQITQSNNRKPTNRLLDMYSLLNDDLIKVHDYSDLDKPTDDITEYYSDDSMRKLLEETTIWQFQ